MGAQKEEDDFNAWFNKQTINAVPDADLSLQRLWASLAWQAAKAQAVPEVLKKFCNEHKDPAWRGRLTEYDKGYSDCCIAVLEMIESQQPSSTSGCPDEP